MIVVSDTSPIINLAAVHRLDLLASLFGSVLIPTAVFDEIRRGGHDAAGSQELRTASWIDVRPVLDRRLVASLQVDLDPGEAEAIALAMEAGAGRLLMDERRGRHAARLLGVPVLGLLGVLVLAKQSGVIDAVRPTLDALLVQAGFYVGQDLRLQVLEAVGEQ